MTWFMLVIQILKKLPELLHIAEEAFDDEPESGAQKKEMVVTTIQVITSGVIGDEAWNKISKIVLPVVNFMCLFFFPHEN